MPSSNAPKPSGASSPEFRTDDLALAALLATTGHPVKRLEPQPGRREWFDIVFADTPLLRETLDAWDDGEYETTRNVLAMHDSLYRAIRAQRAIARSS